MLEDLDLLREAEVREARLGDDLVETDYTSLVDSGDMPVRECGRYVRITETIAEGTARASITISPPVLMSSARAVPTCMCSVR